MTRPTPQPGRAMPSGLDAWMEQVAALHAEAARALEVDVVHDLRVALRRCRSLAQGLREVDTRDGARRFKALAAHARPLFDGTSSPRRS